MNRPGKTNQKGLAVMSEGIEKDEIVNLK